MDLCTAARYTVAGKPDAPGPALTRTMPGTFFPNCLHPALSPIPLPDAAGSVLAEENGVRNTTLECKPVFQSGRRVHGSR